MNYDNLHIYPDQQFQENTSYRSDFKRYDQGYVSRSKSPMKDAQRLFELNKTNNQITYAMNLPKDNFGKETSYKQDFGMSQENQKKYLMGNQNPRQKDIYRTIQPVILDGYKKK